jgi:hypothetical protein
MEFRPNAKSAGVSDQRDSKFCLAPIVKTSSTESRILVCKVGISVGALGFGSRIRSCKRLVPSSFFLYTDSDHLFCVAGIVRESTGHSTHEVCGLLWPGICNCKRSPVSLGKDVQGISRVQDG